MFRCCCCPCCCPCCCLLVLACWCLLVGACLLVLACWCLLVGACLLVLACWCLLVGVCLLVLGCWCLLVGACLLVLACWCLLVGACLLVLACWCLLVGACLLVLPCWCLLVGACLLVLACWCLLVGACLLVLACWCLLVGACLLVLVGGVCVCVVCVVCVVCGGCVLCVVGGCGGCVQDFWASPPTPSAGPPFPWTAQNFALFFSLSRRKFLSFFSLWEVSSWNFVVFEAPGRSNVHVWSSRRAAGVSHNSQRIPKGAHLSALALQTPPKFHEKTPREGRKNEISGGRERKKSAKFWVVRRRGPSSGEAPKILKTPTKNLEDTHQKS